MSHEDPNIDEIFRAFEAYYLAAKALSPEQVRQCECDGGGFEHPEATALQTVALALKHGVAAPRWAADAFLHALRRYEQFEVKSLGEAFKTADHTQLEAKRTHRLMAAIYSAVRDKREKAKEKPNALRGGLTPEEIVGKQFGLSKSTVRDKCRAWKELCARTGTDPDERLRMPDAAPDVLEALSSAFRKPDRGDVQ